MPTPNTEVDTTKKTEEHEGPLGMLHWLWLSTVVFALDMITKQLSEHFLQYGQAVPVLPVFDLKLLYNTGAAFSFLAGQSGWQRWFFAAIAIGVSIMLVSWLRKLPKSNVWLAVALSLVLGGALGNLFDRMAFGHVIDFIALHWNGSYFPAFNIADSAITVGAIMLAVDVFRNPGK